MDKLKRIKRAAMRYENTKASFEAIASFACVSILVKSVHAAWLRYIYVRGGFTNVMVS